MKWPGEHRSPGYSPCWPKSQSATVRIPFRRACPLPDDVQASANLPV
jgi:hypothetical protein